MEGQIGEPHGSASLDFEISAASFVSSRGSTLLAFHMRPAESGGAAPAVPIIRDASGLVVPAYWSNQNALDGLGRPGSLLLADLRPGAYELQVTGAGASAADSRSMFP